MRNVTVIPASIHKFSDVPLATKEKRKVAAYARVSTDDEDQQTSYAAQCDYYERYIKSRSDWEFVKVYADEGLSGCNTKKRESFKAMVQDALNGKIQLIVTKSVSRFARNTVTASPPYGNSRNMAWRSGLKRRTSGHSKPAEKFSWLFSQA